jgi:glycosyltransferase involved in cell wall biosynthesis
VGFFASSFVNRYGSGTGKHFAIVTKLLCNDFNSKVEVTIFCNSREQLISLKGDFNFSNANLILFPPIKGSWLKSSRQYFKYAFSSRQNKIDVLHFSVPRLYPFFWLFPARKFVCTFHAGGDITAEKDNFILSREIYNLSAKVFFRKLDAIIAVSEFGKNEISSAYGIPEELISVMHVGTDDIWKTNLDSAKKYSRIGKKLIVIIGRWQKYKNVQVVAKALAEANLSELNQYYFVFVGKKITSNVDLIEKLLSRVDDKVYETVEYLDEENYAKIVSEADLVIVPSLNEGFSHPVFDAFSFGTRLLIHHPSPAAQILINKKGVLLADLSSSYNLINLINEAIQMPKSDLMINRAFLKSIEATWEGLTKNYLKLYSNINGV